VGMSRASNSLTVYEANNEFEKINVDNTEPVSQKFVNEFRSLQMSIGEFLAD
jgi:hypothetical protein